MSQRPSLAQLMEAYLAAGTRTQPWPGTEHQRLVDLIGTEAAEAKAKELDGILSTILDGSEVREAKTLADVATQASALAKTLYPDFGESLCREIGRYASYRWK